MLSLQWETNPIHGQEKDVTVSDITPRSQESKRESETLTEVVAFAPTPIHRGLPPPPSLPVLPPLPIAATARDDAHSPVCPHREGEVTPMDIIPRGYSIYKEDFKVADGHNVFHVADTACVRRLTENVDPSSQINQVLFGNSYMTTFTEQLSVRRSA